MRHSVLERMEADIAEASSDAFSCLCRRSERDFTRWRKLPIDRLVLAVLARKGRSLSMEMRDLEKNAVAAGGISVPGFLKQRMKLNPEALLYLARFHAAQVYSDTDALKLFKGHILLAVDGSSLNIPTTPETIEEFGNASTHGRAQAALGISALHDVLNRQTVGLRINRHGFDERAELLAHLEGVRDVVGDTPFVVIGDRGYPSFELFCALIDNEVPFVIRASKTFCTSEFKSMKGDDAIATVQLTHARLAWLRQKDEAAYRKLKERKQVTLRFVKVALKGGNEEWLITNLGQDDFSTSDIAEIYRLRWEVEGVFQVMKGKLQLENFSAMKSLLIRQDIYAVVYLCNLAFDLATEAEYELEKRCTQKVCAGLPYAHTMTISKAFSVGVVKDEIIRFVMAPHEEKASMMDKIVSELSRNIVPVREGRSFERNMSVHNAKHNNTHKRSF